MSECATVLSQLSPITHSGPAPRQSPRQMSFGSALSNPAGVV